MKIKVEKIMGLEWAQRACESTFRGSSQTLTLDKIYKCEHSPIRTQMFWVEMSDVPVFVSTHFIRHKIGAEHWAMTQRDDRGGAGNDVVTRNTPTFHSMLVNAQVLIAMAKKRLCYQSSDETVELMNLMREAVREVDPTLAKYMVPECVYRNGLCPELKPCGKLKLQMKKYGSYFD